jgi:hypothetical protein
LETVSSSQIFRVPCAEFFGSYIDQIIVDDNSKFLGIKPGLPVSMVNDPVVSEASASSVSQFGSLSAPDFLFSLSLLASFHQNSDCQF